MAWRALFVAMAPMIAAAALPLIMPWFDFARFGEEAGYWAEIWPSVLGGAIVKGPVAMSWIGFAAHGVVGNSWLTALAWSIAQLPLLLSWFGFGATGVVAGSFAAIWQSALGGTVASGSVFAFLQALGMRGAIGILPAAAITTIRNYRGWKRSAQKQA